MRFILSTILLFCLYSCAKTPPSTSSSVIKNNTNHYIEIRPYRNGAIDNTLRFSVAPLKTITPINNSKIYSKSIGDPLGTLYINYDSVVVYFDSVKSTKHNKYDDNNPCPNCLLASNNRAISNPNNWSQNIIKEEEKRMDGYFEYTFEETDYTFAK